MPRRFVVVEDAVPTSPIDGRAFITEVWAYVERLAYKHRIEERLRQILVTADTCVPHEARMLLIAALGSLLLRQALIMLSAWRALQRHKKAE